MTKFSPSSEKRTILNRVGGKLVGGNSGRKGKLYNPSYGIEIGEVIYSSEDDIESAVSSCRGAYEEWSAYSPLKRGGILQRYRELLLANEDKMCALLTQEHGKTLGDSKGEFWRGIEVLDYAYGAGHTKLMGSYARGVSTDIDTYNYRYPLGVVGGITPFNFPIMIPLWMFSIALAAGNSFILKPSEKDPSTTLLLAELLEEAGAPLGLLNVIQGDKEAVDAMLKHQDIKAISFVGSSPIASYVYEKGGLYGKRISSFGGGKNHLVVMPDADLEKVSDALIGSGYGSAGERCMAISMVLAVGSKTEESLLEVLERKVRKLRVGAGHESSSDFGALVTREHRDKVLGYIDTGIKEGARLLVDGRQVEVAEEYRDGFYVGGCLFSGVESHMTIYKEEIFGPVLSVCAVGSYEEAVELVSRHQFGNGASIFTNDGNIGRHFADSVEIGMVGINVPIPVPVAYHSFGGWKLSHFGDCMMYGEEGLRFFSRPKTITSRWSLETDSRKVQLDFPSN